MKKNALIVLAVVAALFVSGCIAEVEDDGQVVSTSLVDPGTTKDTFTLSDATSRSAEAFEYAFSDGEPLDDDMFLTYIEAAKIAQELENYSAATIDQDLAQAAEEVGEALGSALKNIFDPLASLFGGIVPSSNPATTDPGTSGGTTGGQTTSPATTADKNSQALTALFNEYKVYDVVAQAAISEYNSDPWSSRDIRIPDDILVSLVAASHEIFDFVKSHPNVKDGDEVLSSVGDTMVTIYGIWGLGRYEAQTAFLMINLYYPNGSYVPHAEQQLLLL